MMKYLKTPLIAILITFLLPVIAQAAVDLNKTGDYLSGEHKYERGTDFSLTKTLKYQTSNTLLTIDYYYLENDSIFINGILFEQISYIFFKGKYHGYIVYLNDKHKKFGVKEYFFNESNFLQKKGKYYIWQNMNEVIVFQDFSVHQGRVIYLYKTPYLKDHPDFYKMLK